MKLPFAFLCLVFSLFDLVSCLLPERSLHHLRQHQSSSPFSRQLEQEDNRNRKHVWDWLDRIHNERRNRSSSSSTNKALSFVFATAKPPASNEAAHDREDELTKKDAIRSKKLPRDAIGDSSIEVDYADEPSSNGDGPTDPDLFDQMKASIESKKLGTTPKPSSITSTSTSTPIFSRPRSSSISSVLKFSSNRTNALKASKGTSFVSINQKNQKKRTSSVLNLPPVKQDWTFTCPAGKSGYFADVDNDCRVYYVCSSDRGERQRFACPTGTRFNQDQANCDWWDKVVCEQPDSPTSNQFDS